MGKKGRPSVMTPEKIKELEGYFMYGMTDEEACLLADISRQAMNEYCKGNEDWRERKEILKRKPLTTAKINIVDKIKGQDYDASKWYLERKAKDEFSLKQEIDQNQTVVDITDDISEAQKKLIAERFTNKE